MRILVSVLALAFLGCTPSAPAPVQAQRSQPGPAAQKADEASAVKAPAAAPADPAQKFGPECTAFLSGVARSCPDSRTDGVCEQLRARRQELHALKPGSDGTHQHYDWLCQAEMANLKKAQ